MGRLMGLMGPMRPMRPMGLIGLMGLMASCEKDIDIDYHQVEPRYVVEAGLTTDRTTVRITTTQAMDDNSNGIGVDGATVVVTSGDSINRKLTYSGKGYYTSALRGTPGTRYTLTIDVDGHRFTSTSTMQPQPTFNAFRFVWKKVTTERVMLGALRIQDIPSSTNYYFLHIYRNNIGYRWAVIADNQRDATGEIQQLFNCVSERDQEKGTSGDVLHDGDRIHIEIRAIDRPAYDYLYSMQLMDNTGTNPISNFEGGCLGYFTAYNQITYDCIFRADEVEEE